MAKGMWLAAMAAMAALGAAGGAAAAEITLIENGKSDYVVVTPDKPDPSRRVGQAGDLLRTVLEKATGAKLPVFAESKAPKDKPAIYLGMTEAARKAGLPLDRVTGWATLKQVRGRDVFLVGVDDTAGIKGVDQHQYLGTLKAVTSFLEDEVGARFLAPGPNGLCVPRLDRLAVRADLAAVRQPVFAYVTGRRTGDNAYNCANNYLGNNLVKSYGGHSYYSAVPAEKYGKTHPEYFALIGGVRTSAKNHLCISNPDAQKLMIEEMTKWLDMGFQWVELAQTDGYQPCECPQCAAMHPDIAERLWIVHRKLAQEMRGLRPGKKVMIISYGPTSKPPVSFKDFPDNVVIQMCRYAPEDFDAWKSFNTPSTVYLYNWGSYQIPGYGPKRTPRYAADQVKRFVQSGVAGIYLCGAFENMGLEGPVYYVYGKTLGDPSLNEAELLGDYCRAAFGKARAPMLKFFEAMYARLEAFSLTNRPNYRSDAPAGVRTFSTPEDFYCHFFPAKLLAEMAANLERAKAADADPEVQARLSLVEQEFAYVRNLASIFQLYRAYRLRPGWHSFDLLAAELDQREALLKTWFDDKGNAKAFDGWTRFMGGATLAEVRAGGRLGGTLSAPVNWNTRLLREKQVLPGVGARTARVARLNGLKLDGRLDDPAWAAAAPQDLGEIGMGELANGARFRLGRDDEALYVAFECEHENLAALDVQPRGQDGAVWQDECVELLIDPLGGREKYYHFIFAPVPKSFYDARKGFIDDPVHPLFDRADKSWNGAWDYAVIKDPATGRWTAEVRIPFSTLGADPPAAGSSWTMNVGRAQFLFKDGKRKAPVLSLWSPNLEERSFHSTAGFGDVVFD